MEGRGLTIQGVTMVTILNSYPGTATGTPIVRIFVPSGQCNRTYEGHSAIGHTKAIVQ